MAERENGKNESECAPSTGAGGAPPGGTPRSGVTIEVEPLFQQRNQVVCAIDPPGSNSKGGSVKLRRGQSYTLEFELQPVNPPAPQVTFRSVPGNPTDGRDAFWCDADDCPRNAQMDAQYGNPRLSNAGRTLKVDVTPSSSSPPNAVHYRLNFEPNGFFDPIIIHD